MNIKGRRIRSRITGKQGIIERVEKGKLYISFNGLGVIPIDLKKYSEILDVDDETKEELDSLVASLHPTKKR